MNENPILLLRSVLDLLFTLCKNQQTYIEGGNMRDLGLGSIDLGL